MDDRGRVVWSDPRARCKVSISDISALLIRLTIPRAIAEQMTEAAPPEKAILIDCFAGVGGNVIAFAQSGRWKRVYAIEKDPKALACAKHNAEIYGVQDKISWYEGDCFLILSNELVDLGEHSVIFASPPWGGKSNLAWLEEDGNLTVAGPGYRSDMVFDLSTMQPYTLSELLEPFQRLANDVALYLPRTSDMRQLANEATESGKTTVMHYCMEGASKVSRAPSSP